MSGCEQQTVRDAPFRTVSASPEELPRGRQFDGRLRNWVRRLRDRSSDSRPRRGQPTWAQKTRTVTFGALSFSAKKPRRLFTGGRVGDRPRKPSEIAFLGWFGFAVLCPSGSSSAGTDTELPSFNGPGERLAPAVPSTAETGGFRGGRFSMASENLIFRTDWAIGPSIW